MATKKEMAAAAKKRGVLVEKAQKLGVHVVGTETDAELETSIKSAQKEVDATKKGLGGKEPTKNATAVDVVDGSGVLRTYSKAQHGAKFLDHANEFAGKVEGRKVVVSGTAE